jgi:RNA polymerase sigma-70 factor (ECF subfamily)
MNRGSLEIEEYIRNNQESIYRFAYSYVKNRTDALDIVQESIYKALKNYRSLKDNSKIKSWLFSIVRNTSLTYLKKSKREILYEVVPEKIEKNINEVNIDSLDLYSAIEKLPVESKELIVMRYLEDMELKEMAKILKININTLKSRLYKTIQELRLVYVGRIS